MQVRLERKALPDDCLPHLLLRFESNGSHRHLRVAPFFFPPPTEAQALSTDILPAITDRGQLRRELRARRRAIAGKARKQAGRKLARLVDKARWLRPGKRIGLYLSMPEELDTAPLLQLARLRGCTIALPRIVSKRHSRMRFFVLDGPIKAGAYGMLEPGGRQQLRTRELDLVFMPLVGFDAAGNRIGMGKGFYDRCFAHRIRVQHWRRPLLAGVAYDVQQVASLPAAKHDVPLDMIVTDSSMRRFRRSNP